MAESSPPFEAPYAICGVWGASIACEPTRTIEPPPFSFMAGRTAREPSGWSDRDDGDNTTGAGADADTDTESDPGNPIGGPAGEH